MRIVFSLFLAVLTTFGAPLDNAAALTISGTMVVPGSGPARKIRVYVSGVNQPIFTNSSGVFSVIVPADGEYTVTPYPAGSKIAVPSRRVVTVSGSNVTGVNFDIRPPGTKIAIRGRILQKTGGPMVNTEVYISNVGRISTDANGIFVVSNLDPKRYVVTPYAPGFTFSPAYRSQLLYPGRVLSLPVRATPLPTGVSVPTYLSGVYNTDIRRTSGTCSVVPETIEGVAAIAQRSNTVKFYLPRLGYSSFPVTSDGFSGEVHKWKLLCLISGDMTTTFASHDEASFTSTVKVTCLGVERCNATFEGTLRRR